MKILIRHAEDLAAMAIKAGCSATKFLTPIESMEIMRLFTGRKDIKIVTEGGFKESERVRIIFLNSDWGEWRREDMVAVLRISHHASYKIGHRDVLGAVLNMGIKRDMVGDIWMDSPHAFLICMPEITEYIIGNLTKIASVGVDLEQIPLEQLPDKHINLVMKTITVSSVRLDGIISGMFHISRSNASKLILQGQVQVGHLICNKQDKEIREGVILSVRGFGRARIMEVEGKTRKDRIRLKVGIYR